MDPKSLVELKEPNVPAFRPGDTVRIHARVIEGDRERIQAFEGVVIGVRRRGPGSTFTVRRVSHGIGVERTFPYYSPLIEKVEVVRVGRVRRAKLYYLRERIGKGARIRAGSRARFEELTAVRPAEIEEEETEEEEIEAEEETPEVAESEAQEEAEGEAAGEAEEAEEEEASGEGEEGEEKS